MRFKFLRDGKPRHRQPGKAARLGDIRDKHHLPHVHRTGHHHNSRVPGSTIQVNLSFYIFYILVYRKSSVISRQSITFIIFQFLENDFVRVFVNITIGNIIRYMFGCAYLNPHLFLQVQIL